VTREARSKTIVVAGSGKMARDLGLFFLGRGHSVSWLSRDEVRLETLERWIRKRVRRLASLFPDWKPGEPAFFVVGDPEVPAADVFIESINEEEREKQELLRSLDEIIPPGALRFSNSSSILPATIHPSCAGLHFFYPVELTGFVEAVFPEDFDVRDKERILDLLRESELECVEEGTETAFAVNRLLLPVQNECFRALRTGRAADDVDEATVSDLLPLGQLTLIDNIGLDVVYPAVCNFTSRMGPGISDQYEPLRAGLRELLDIGKRGHKNRDGIRLGQPLPWNGGPEATDGSAPPFDALIRALFLNSCQRALEEELLTAKDLDLALCSLFGWERDLAETWEHSDIEGSRKALDGGHRLWGCDYFVPCGELRRRAGE